jgi:hypothetical protein
MKKNFIIFSTFFSFICMIAPSLEAATLHAILVGDTHDKELREVIKKDLKHMDEHLDTIFEFLDVDEYEQTTYTGRDTNSELLDDLAEWKVKPDDIIFFYFSGHGFYGENAEVGNWPTLYLSKEDVGINQWDIMQTLHNHHPRLLICFADCCNNILDEDDKPQILTQSNMPDKKIVRQKGNSNAAHPIHKLFLETKGVIMIASASPKYYAEGTDDEGSSFTNCYLKDFKKAIRSNQKETNWEAILSQSQQALWKKQRPQYQLILY